MSYTDGGVIDGSAIERLADKNFVGSGFIRETIRRCHSRHIWQNGWKRDAAGVYRKSKNSGSLDATTSP